jgi:galactonate dehydratase
MVLEELRKEAQKCIQQKQHSTIGQTTINNTSAGTCAHRRLGVTSEQYHYEPANFSQSAFSDNAQGIEDAVSHNPSMEMSDMQTVPPAWIEDLMQDSSPGTYIPSLTSWGEFDSLALTGLGELGYIFSSDNLQDLEE